MATQETLPPEANNGISDALPGLVGISPAMQRVYRLIKTSSRFAFPVLIMGESGTGKELTARAIHDLSSRRNQPFVPVDCSTLARELAESELFGHVRGAFTDAMRDKIGLLEEANGGTVFLDEIGELPLGLQAKLLRVLQEHEIRRVGSNQYRTLNIRLIAATNRDLEGEIQRHAFRQDLYFRLNVVRIDLPPLRERKGDLPLLINLFFRRFSDLQPSAQVFSDKALAQLARYDWPGNVRELENAVEHAIAVSSGPTIGVDDLPSSVRSDGVSESPAGSLIPWSAVEKRAILRALEETSGDKIAAAAKLGIGKTTLYRKLRKYKEDR